MRVQYTGDPGRIQELARSLRSNDPGGIERFVENRCFGDMSTGPNRVALSVLDDDTPAVFKIFGWRKPWHAWLSPLGRSRSLRSYRTAIRLLEIGVRTPSPILALEVRRFGFLRMDCYLSESLGDTRSARELLREVESTDPIVVELARIVKRMHDGGLYHRDLTLANFRKRAGEDDYYVIDLNRARRMHRVPFPLRIEDIARMDLSEAQRPVFLRAYFAREEVGRILRLIEARRFVRSTLKSLKRLLRRPFKKTQ
jgi:tRNA A-37 threonylcarbamoyl transferase component Bud32